MTYSDDEVHEQLTDAAGAVRSAFSVLPIPHEVPDPRRLRPPVRLPQFNLAAAAIAIAVAGLVALLAVIPGEEATEVVATRYLESEVSELEPTSTPAREPAGDGASVGTALVTETPVAEARSETPTAAAESPTPDTAPTEPPNQSPAPAPATPAPEVPAAATPVETPTPAPETPTPETAAATPVPVPTPVPAPTPTPVPVPTPTSVPTPTPTPVPTPTPTPVPALTPTSVPTPTATPVPAPTSTPAPTPTVIPELDICYGAIDTVIQTAKANYTAACGIAYSDTSGVHQCVWIDDEGWRCHGPRADGNEAAVVADSAPGTVSNPTPTVIPELDICYGEIDTVIQTAKANYTAACGIPYSDTSGVHQCVWIDDEGWRCHGRRADDGRSQ